ncbi:hypothetical protein RHGRI_016906 [Rhododendron griersonianum]|uniref:Uncharacterized protein n=1 Tax=Rhododendron griersonianum TaxID=479676 RepID=A0AAV6JVX3_9ERIC|nr:hypothetical protein RHGRI_016906 [Rhododendron griersonianum]
MRPPFPASGSFGNEIMMADSYSNKIQIHRDETVSRVDLHEVLKALALELREARLDVAVAATAAFHRMWI